MSGNQEDPNASKKLVGIGKSSPPNEVAPQDVLPQETRTNSSISTAPRNTRSSHSLGSTLTPENHATHSSSSNPARTNVNDPFQSMYQSRQGNNVTPQGQRDNVSGYSDGRSAARTRYNTYANIQYYSPPPDDRRSYSYGNGDTQENPFSEKSIRRAFIRKVYTLIMCMMLFASAVVTFMMFYSPARRFILQNMWLVIVSWALYPILMMILICFEKARRTVPYNYFVLFLITLSLSFLAGCSAARYNKYEVLAAFGITAILCLSLTIFAFQTKWDFTVISGGLVVASLVMLIFGVVLVFWRNKTAMIGYACLGALLGSFFFIFDTQMIVGGNHRYAINPEEYVFAAITLFSDMINIFIMVTNIIGLSRS